LSLGPERPPDLLQLLPQPGGEGLPEAVQQLGQVHVVVPVVPGQVRMGLGGGDKTFREGVKLVSQYLIRGRIIKHGNVGETRGREQREH